MSQHEPRYYRIAMIGHIEHHVKGDPFTETYEELSAQGHAVVVLDPKQYPGLLSESGEPDLGYLERFIETFRPDYISPGDENAEQILAAIACDPSKGMTVPPRKFIVFGYLGRGNFGDELILSLLTKQLYERYPGSYVVVLGHVAEPILQTHGIAMVSCYEKSEVSRVINGASAVVFIAGLIVDTTYKMFTPGITGLFLQPFMDVNGQAAVCMLAYLHHVPAVFLGVGAGPLSDPSAKAMLNLASLTKPLFLCRDADTASMVAACDVDASLIRTYTDTACLLNGENLEKYFPPLEYADAEGAVRRRACAEKGYIVVSMREVFDLKDVSRTDILENGLDATFVDRTAALLDQVAEKRDIDIVFVDFAPEDKTIHDCILEAMTAKAHATHLTFADLDPRDYLNELIQLIAHATCCIAMRLHVSIIATMLDVSSVGLDYNDKVHAFYDSMSELDRLIPMDFDVEQALAVLDEAIGRVEIMLDERLAERAKKNDLAIRMMSDFFSVVDETVPSYTRPDVVFPKADILQNLDNLANRVHELEDEHTALMREREALLADVERLNQRIDDIEHSNTWKVGMKVLAIPKAIKHGINRQDRDRE